ncbi:MAG: phosphoribosylanthranilate isomerase [Sphingomonadaceae bacterium]|nr:phosphoribosylanthranilate isomerase [Sphingomonadaceae bacterium]
MSRVAAKICGLSTPETVDAAVAGGARHIGFVFFPKSPRDIAPEQAGALARRVPEHVGKVGVFVDPDDALIAEAVARAGLTAIQLHGAESPAQAAAFKARHAVEVWKAIAVRTRADLAAAHAYRGAADRILYDAKTPPGTLPGGMGLRFDWTLLDGFAHPLPWLLSGGLDADNVGDAIGITSARAVDVSSGVESAPGVKDVDRIARFCQAVASL